MTARQVTGHGRGPPRCRGPDSRDPPSNGRGPPNGKDPPFYLQPVRAGPIATAENRTRVPAPWDRPRTSLDAPKVQFSHGHTQELCGMTKYDTQYTGSIPVGSGLHTGCGIGIGRGDQGASLLYALLAIRGSIFQNPAAGFRIVGKPGPTTENDPPHHGLSANWGHCWPHVGHRPASPPTRPLISLQTVSRDTPRASAIPFLSRALYCPDVISSMTLRRRSSRSLRRLAL